MKNLYGDISIEHDEQLRQCWHCGASEDDGARLQEAHCEYGDGILHCEECSEECDQCREIQCVWTLVFVDTPDGILKVCENCKKEIEEAKQ